MTDKEKEAKQKALELAVDRLERDLDVVGVDVLIERGDVTRLEIAEQRRPVLRRSLRLVVVEQEALREKREQDDDENREHGVPEDAIHVAPAGR